MTTDSRQHDIPIGLQVLLGLCILCGIVLAPVLLFWSLPGPAMVPHANSTLHIKILAVNDFHGHLPPGQTLNNRPVGGAPVLASYLKSAIASGNADGTIIALPGDVIGGSPPESGLFLDEPSILFFNGFANQYCTYRPDLTQHFL